MKLVRILRVLLALAVVTLATPLREAAAAQTEGPAWRYSNATDVTGTFVATGQSSSFRADAGRPFNFELRGTFVGTLVLERSLDGTNWVALSALGTSFSWTAPASEVFVEGETEALYRVNCTAYTSGTVNYRLSQ